MEYLPLSIACFVALASTFFVYWTNRQSKPNDALTTIRLNRLLHYRDKAKALDQYMNNKIDATQLIVRYKKIEADKKAWKDGARNN